MLSRLAATTRTAVGGPRTVRMAAMATTSTRSFSTPRDPRERPNEPVYGEHKPVIDLHGLHARYANATYIAASKTNSLDKVEQELLAIQKTAETSAAFEQFLQNPMISRDDKTKQVQEMLKGKTTSVTLNLMTTLAGNARLADLPKIVSTYVELMKAKRGEVEAVIISADPLGKTEAKSLETAMKNQVGKDKKVVLSYKVDPSILGGLQVQIGDKFLDMSVKSRIDELSRTVV